MSLNNVTLSNTIPCSKLLRLKVPYPIVSPSLSGCAENNVPSRTTDKSTDWIGYKFWFNTKFCCLNVSGCTMLLSLFIVSNLAAGFILAILPISHPTCAQYRYSATIWRQLTSRPDSIRSNTTPWLSKYLP